MKHLKTYEGLNMGGYYDPPDDDDPLFEGVLDRVWVMFSDIGKIDENVIEEYMEMLWNDHYDNILELIYGYERELSNKNGDYPWGEELRKEYSHKKYGRDCYKKEKEMNLVRLQKAIAVNIYIDLNELYPIDNFILHYNAKKYNL